MGYFATIMESIFFLTTAFSWTFCRCCKIAKQSKMSTSEVLGCKGFFLWGKCQFHCTSVNKLLNEDINSKMFENHPFFELCNSKVKNWVRFLFERLRYWYWKNSKNDWKTLCCCYYVWWPTSNICNLSFAKSRKDHYLSKRSKYRIIYCHKITAFDKKKKEVEEIVNSGSPMFIFHLK